MPKTITMTPEQYAAKGWIAVKGTGWKRPGAGEKPAPVYNPNKSY